MTRKSNLLIAFAILIASFLIGGFLILESKTGLADVSTQITGWFSGNKNQDPKSIDSDHDGLPDYLEAIYGTDPHNPDTDGDGYLDGEEIMSGYDPLKPGPDDKISDKATTPRPAKGALAEVNLTDELGKSILENMKNSTPDTSADMGSGNEQDIENGLAPQAETIIDNALAVALAKSPQLNFVPTIQDSYIKISADDSRKAAQDYVSQVRQIISKNISSNKSEATVLQDAVQAKNYSELNPYIDGYLKSYIAIKELSVPPSWKEVHEENLSVLLATANIFQAVKSLDDDPLRATLALQQYQQTVLPNLKDVYEKASKLIQGDQQQIAQ